MKEKLIGFVKKYWLYIASITVSLLMFYPALSSFFTHDDFYFLKISKVQNISEFAAFFDPLHDPEHIGVFRPLPLRAYYFLGTSVFNLNPLGQRVISFVTFFINILLVGYLVKMLTKKDSVAGISAFLYAVSVTHFGQLYYVGAYQELLITFLTLLSVIFFAKSKLIPSFIFFVMGLMSKETAVVIPGLLGAVYLFQNWGGKRKLSFKKLLLSLLPFIFVTAVYLYLHFFHFGTIEGDSYVWNFSPTKALNTTLWYFLWSLNLPEMLVDFVGPGIHLNPNLMKFWSSQIIPIFILFGVEIVIVVYSLIKSIKSKTVKNLKPVILLSGFWFLATILPVVFLPLHKFTYYLTLPLVGVVFIISTLVSTNMKRAVVFSIVWLTLSLFSLKLTINTNWITQGVGISERVFTYFKENQSEMDGKTIVFTDTKEDEDLPWSPTETVKTVISDKNFFELFFPNVSDKISYGGEGEIKIQSRQFLGY